MEKKEKEKKCFKIEIRVAPETGCGCCVVFFFIFNSPLYSDIDVGYIYIFSLSSLVLLFVVIPQRT